MSMVRAERGGRLYDEFKEQGYVAIGWTELGSLDHFPTRQALLDAVRQGRHRT
jgi:restriction system protein